MKPRWIVFSFAAVLAGNAEAAPGDRTDPLRDLASRVGAVIGSASACQTVGQPRLQAVIDKFLVAIRDTTLNDAERNDLSQLLDRAAADGRGAVSAGRLDCKGAERQFADLERSIARPSAAPPVAAPAVAATASAASAGPQRGVNDREIRFGISAAFSGSNRETGRQMKLGIETAFNRINDAGGVMAACCT